MSLATGFMGKVFLERLLRATEVAKIYILVRPKRGKTPKERLVELLDNLVRISNSFTKQTDYSMTTCPYSCLTHYDRAEIMWNL